MNKDNQEYLYITTPIYYVNDDPHIGHAYTSIACDTLARFKRLDGYRVHFITGTDEHGQKVVESARKAGLQPGPFVDMIFERFHDLTQKLNLSHDDFIRTTEARHHRAAHALWHRLVERGNIYLGTYAGWYSVRDEAFQHESEIHTTPEGKRLGPSGAELVWVEEPSYFFRLSQWSDRLLDFYEHQPHFISPESRRNEIITFVKAGLNDLSISRTSLSWGIPVPDNPKHVMYVWIDALTSYLSALGFPEEQANLSYDFWPNSLHVVGKDILRFHAVYWPALLMAAGLDPPKRVFAHGWWTNKKQKISKSLGNVIDPLALINTYGADRLRYFLLREISFGQDGDFSHDSMRRRAHSDLANDYGNLAMRVLSMITRFCDGRLPAPSPQERDALLDSVTPLLTSLRAFMDDLAFHRALEAIFALINRANCHMDACAPWSLRKSNPKLMGEVLYNLAELLRRIAILTWPFMPDRSAELLDQLGVAHDQRHFIHLGDDYQLIPGTILSPIRPLFPRIEESAE